MRAHGRALTRRQALLGGGSFMLGTVSIALATMARPTKRRPFASPRTKHGRFPLDDPARELWTGRTIHHNTVMQSFVFDDVNRHIYVTQLIEDGVRLAGEDEAVGWERRGVDGDIVISRLDFEGTVTGHMYAKRFGHGVGCGLERDGDEVFLWTEVDAGPITEGGHRRYGFGRALARTPFRSDSVVEFGVDDLEVHRMVPDSTGNMPALDTTTDRLALRYFHRDTETPHWRYAVYDRAEVREGRYRPIHDFAQAGIDSAETFQGFTLFGDHVHQMTGTMYGDDNPASDGGNCRLSSIDVHTGDVVARTLTDAGGRLSFREPEGLAVHHPARGPARLFLGFADGEDDDRNANLYYLEQR